MFSANGVAVLMYAEEELSCVQEQSRRKQKMAEVFATGMQLSLNRVTQIPVQVNI